MRAGRAADGKETVETQAGNPDEAQVVRSPRSEKRGQSRTKVRAKGVCAGQGSAAWERVKSTGELSLLGGRQGSLGVPE